MQLLFLVAILLAQPTPSAAWDLPASAEAELIGQACPDPLGHNPILQPIATLAELQGAVEGLNVPMAAYPTAYRDLKVVASGYQSTPPSTYAVDYDIAGGSYRAWAYRLECQAGSTDCAAVVIPGTGQNQSWPIFIRDTGNYQYDVGGIASRHCDAYIYVKPNEDFLSIHNGTEKLSYDCITNRLAAQGGSYSARYLIDTMALVKDLKAQYLYVFVVGLSQGGQAALYNAIQSEPFGCFVASGFSVIQEELWNLGWSQIALPGYALTNEDLYDAISASRTAFAFSYGQGETGCYGIEADYGCTADFLSPLRNVEVHVHPGRHQYPAKELAGFLLSAGGAPQGLALGQNYPNPFSGVTTIPLPAGSSVVTIFDAAGRRVRVLTGRESVQWDGKAEGGAPARSGAYFYAVGSGARKMLLVR